jgi:PKD repeat protein/photosystem II stability/assembly factor-like uncharacterized protein
MKILLLSILLQLMAINVWSQSGWMQLNSGYTQNLYDVGAFDTIVMGVGGNASSGHVVYSYNQGFTFSSVLVSTAQLNALAFNPGGLWVAGNLGKIYHTLNGSVWNQQATGTTTNLNDIQFPTNTTGYAVGGTGVILKTTNASTWSNPVISGGTTYTLNATHFVDTNNGVMGGDYNFIQGFLVRTTSGGSYYSLPYTTISVINDIYFSSPTTGFAVAKAGNIYKTINTGTSWTLISSGTTTNLNAVHFSDSLHGYIVGDGGLVLRTNNGGVTWTQQNSGITTNLNGVYCFNNNIAYAVGDNGTIIKTSSAGQFLTVNVNDTIATCSGFVNLNAQTSYNGSGSLSYTWASSPYLSSTNTALTTAGPLQNAHTFYVTVTDGILTATDSTTVSVVALPTDSLCLVTVDDSLGHNLIVFEKQVSGPILYYKVYAESSVAGVYDSIGFVAADSAGLFVDTNSNPAIKAYSYKISIVDSCINESVLSDFHKTMHLTINQGTGSSWNLIWNHYLGFQVQTYRIWRLSSNNVWTKIDSVSGTNTSYTDLNPPAGSLYYQVEIISPNTCNPYISKANTNYNSSRSNTAHNGIIPTSLSADFSADVLSGILPLTVQFTDLSAGSPTAYLWDFGDGDTSSLANPSHIYTMEGIYTVSLIISKASEVDTLIKPQYINVITDGINPISHQVSAKVYPNPMEKGSPFRLEIQTSLVSKLLISDALGRTIPFEQTTTAQGFEIDLKCQQSGIYTIKLYYIDGSTSHLKIMIQ